MKIFRKIKVFYYSIPTKLLAILILFFIFLYLFFYIKENFVNNNWKIIINSNVNNYHVKLYKNLLKNFEKEKFCVEKKCEINDVIPSEYKLIIKKDWYKDIIKNFEINKKTTLEINIILSKKIFLKKKNNIEKIVLTRQEKIKNLNARLKNEQILKIWDKKYLKEKKINDKIFIFLNDKEILNFKDLNKDIFFDKIFWEKNLIFIYSWEKIYFFDLITKNLFFINFKIKPIYIKKLGKNFLIITGKGAFIYNLDRKKLDYFYLFKDFVKYKNNLIWIIYSWEKNKKKNLWINDNNNLIIKYNKETKERKIIYKTLKNIEKIFVKNKKIYIILDNEVFLLNWID